MAAYPPMESELVELRRLLHDVLELSARIARRWGPRELHTEVETLLRIVCVWGGQGIQWGRDMQ